MITVITPSIRPQYLHLTQKCLEAQTFQDFEWLVEVGLPSRGFTLPRDMNRMLARANGDIIVSLQDCISIPPNALEQVAELPLGHKAYTFPIGKHGSFDWRMGAEREITPNEWEIDLAAAPKSLFFDVGGFDEAFCDGWSWENVEIAWRAEAAGYSFAVSHAMIGDAIDHDKEVEHPFRNSLPLNAPKANQALERARRGDFKMPYLF